MQGGEAGDTGTTERPRLFLSYTRADIDRARPIIAMLEDSGFDVWWDGLIEGGDHYLPATEAALEGADCVVVLWSRLSVDSNWVRDEAQSGRDRGRLVPVSLDGSMAPLGFRQIQLIDISGWDGDPKAPELHRIPTAIHRLIDPQGPGAVRAASSSRSPTPAPARGVSRRNLVLGAAGLSVAAGVIGAWQFGGFGDREDGTVMSMAVLRFANLTGETEQAWFSDGLSNELRQVLSRNPRLRVSAPTSSRGDGGEDDFELARALGVGTILRGSVQRAADTVRIFAELVEIEGAVIRWSESYDRNLADVFAVQTEIAETVGRSLVIEFAGEDATNRALAAQQDVGGTENVVAYEAYLRGSELANLSAGPESDTAALAYFDTAIEADPDYAAAHAMRATMLAAIASSATDADQFEALFGQAIQAAQQSIRLEPALARGHRILGFALSYGQLDPAAASPHYDRALECAPGDAATKLSVAQFYAYGDKRDQAVTMAEDVLDLDPLNPQAFRTASAVALLAHDYSRTAKYAEQALKLNPKLSSANFYLGMARLLRKDTEGAITAFQAEPVAIFSLVGLAIAHKAAGNAAAAQAAYQQMLDTYGDASLYQQVQVLAQWGDAEAALATLARAFEVGDPGVLWAPNDPMLDPLRGDAQFNRLLLRLTT